MHDPRHHNPAPPRSGRPPGRGVSLVYLVVAFAALCGFVSLAADYGRVQLVKSELRTAADAAARAAGVALAGGPASARQAAVDVAAANTADGTRVALDPATDVELGTWDRTNRTFTRLTGAGTGAADAVRVTARRTAATGNAVRLFFAGLVGRATCDARATAVAVVGNVLPSGVVGIDEVRMSGSALVDAYNSAAGPYSAASASANGDVSSNGAISLSGGATIRGDATPGAGDSVTGGVVTGSRAQATSDAAYEPVTVGPYATTNDNANMAAYVTGNDFTMGASAIATMPPGTYCFHDFTMSGGSVLTITGRTTIYVTGKLNISGSVQNVTARPSNLTVLVASTGEVKLSGGSNFCLNLYAPEAPFSMTGGAALYGSVVAESLTLNSSLVHFDLAGTSGARGVTLVY